MFPSGWVKYDDLNKEIEKRRPGVKKPKENKKPVISASSTSAAPTTTTISTITSTDSKLNNNNKIKETNSNSSKSVLSTSNSLLKTKDVSVKKNSTPPLPISTSSSTISNNISNSSKQPSENSSSKKTNSVSIGYSSSLTITPVTSTATNFTKSYNNVQNKVTITNIDNTTTNIPSQISNLIKNSEQLRSKSKTPPIIKTISSTAPKLPSSLSISITPTNNSPNSCTVTSTNSTTTTTTTTASAAITTTKLDNSQISRRTSDYSINSIMSAAAAPAAGSNSQKLPENLQKKSIEKTQLINLDSLKNKDELVQHLSSNSNSVNSNLTKDNLLKIRSVDHMNNQFKSGSSDNNNSKNSNNKIGHITTISSEEDDLLIESDSSDGVEIVGVFPVSSKKQKTKTKNHIIVNKSKYSAVDPLQIDGNVKSSSTSSRSNKVCDEIQISKPYSIAIPSDTEVDVNKIMKELKELVS